MISRRGTFKWLSPLLVAAAVVGCGTEVELFLSRAPASSPGTGETRGTVGLGGAGFGGAGFGGAGPAREVGFPSDADVLGLRVVIFDKEDTGFAVHFKTVSFELQTGDAFPSAPLSASDPNVTAVQWANHEGNALWAFDADSSTAWSLGSDDLPGAIGLLSRVPIETPVALFVDVRQVEFRAPSDFDVQAFDGRDWWTMLAVRELFDWADPGDETFWMVEQKYLPLNEPSAWFKKGSGD